MLKLTACQCGTIPTERRGWQGSFVRAGCETGISNDKENRKTFYFSLMTQVHNIIIRTLKNIWVEFLPPNTTFFILPLNAGIIIRIIWKFITAQCWWKLLCILLLQSYCSASDTISLSDAYRQVASRTENASDFDFYDEIVEHVCLLIRIVQKRTLKMRWLLSPFSLQFQHEKVEVV